VGPKCRLGQLARSRWLLGPVLPCPGDAYSSRRRASWCRSGGTSRTPAPRGTAPPLRHALASLADISRRSGQLRALAGRRKRGEHADFDAVKNYVNARELTVGTTALPATAGIAGRWYLATDVAGGTLYEDNGTVWTLIAGGVTAAFTGILDVDHGSTGTDTLLASGLPTGPASTGALRAGPYRNLSRGPGARGRLLGREG